MNIIVERMLIALAIGCCLKRKEAMHIVYLHFPQKNWDRSQKVICGVLFEDIIVDLLNICLKEFHQEKESANQGIYSLLLFLFISIFSITVVIGPACAHLE